MYHNHINIWQFIPPISSPFRDNHTRSLRMFTPLMFYSVYLCCRHVLVSWPLYQLFSYLSFMDRFLNYLPIMAKTLPSWNPIQTAFMHFSTHVLYCSRKTNSFVIKISGSRHRCSSIRATTSDIALVQERSTFIQAKVRSGLLRCNNCCAGRHGSHMVCFNPVVLDSTEQDIMISTLDDGLLDYTTTFPFVIVYAVAQYLLLEESFFRHLIETYALLRQEDTYLNTHFLLVIHNLFIEENEDFARYFYRQFCARSPKTVAAAHRAYPNLFHSTGFFWGGAVIKLCYFILFCCFVYT